MDKICDSAHNDLAIAADLIGSQDAGLPFYDYDELVIPAHHKIAEILSVYLVYDSEWNCGRAAALLDCDPDLFSYCDAKLAIRALWKSDRVGFYWGGRHLYRNGWVSQFLRSIGNFKNANASVPNYPEPEHIASDWEPKQYWHGYVGYWQAVA